MKAKEQPQTIESHVTSLELSKKLKELGVKQESQFGWVQDYREEEQAVLEYLPAASWGSVILPAYLASELWEMLPPFIRVQKHYGEQIVQEVRLRKVLTHRNNICVVGYLVTPCTDADTFYPHSHFNSINQANAAAEALIWCIEKGYYKP